MGGDLDWKRGPPVAAGGGQGGWEVMTAAIADYPHQFRVVEIFDQPEAIGDAVTSWLAEWEDPLVPSALASGGLALRPPAG